MELSKSKIIAFSIVSILMILILYQNFSTPNIPNYDSIHIKIKEYKASITYYPEDIVYMEFNGSIGLTVMKIQDNFVRITSVKLNGQPASNFPDKLYLGTNSISINVTTKNSLFLRLNDEISFELVYESNYVKLSEKIEYIESNDN